MLLKSVLTPALALERLLKIAAYPHSADQITSLSFEQWTSCKKKIEYFLFFNHLKISRLFILFDSPLAFNGSITNSSENTVFSCFYKDLVCRKRRRSPAQCNLRLHNVIT